jgi:hypothetical protein
MITNVLFIKKLNGKNYYFDYCNISGNDIIKFADQNNLNYGIDGLEWIFDNKKYCLMFNGVEFADAVIHNNKIFIQYQSLQAKFPVPNNLVIYTPTGEIEKILSTPILPTGKQAAGFFQIGDLKYWKNIPKGFENYLSIVVWEHERSEWVYQYFFNPETYEFVFGHRYRN